MIPIYGFDLSSRKVAMCTLDGSDVSKHIVATTKLSSRGEELCRIAAGVRRFFENVMPGFVYIEAPVVGRGGARPTILQSQVDGLLQAHAVQFGHHGVYSVNNKTWKKAVVGNGNASKDDTRAWLEVAHPVLSALCGDDQDLVDAAGVALYGRGVITRSEERYPEAVHLDT